MNRTDSIKQFLTDHTHPDLSKLYNHDMEVQVNVARDGGERVEKEYQGRLWQGWTDNNQVWKSFRIPYKASSDPEYTDKPMTFSLEEHAEGIGMTGWDWRNRVSKWVGFDFDSIVNHASGLTDTVLREIISQISNVPWVTSRYSTSGSGFHLYVFFDDVPTSNHSEHAALGRAILGQLAAVTGYDFNSKVDICGGNMWVWHRKMKGDGLRLKKRGTILKDIPVNWKDHVPVVTGKRNKTLPETTDQNLFDELTSQRTTIPLDDSHRKLIDYLQENSYIWYWAQDHHALVTHVYALLKAHKDLQLRGIYQTLSQGTDLHEQNCFCHPLRRGAWVIRRFTPGVKESETWFQDAAGWTTCYFNQEPDLRTTARAFGGVEDTDGGFVFREAEVAIEAAEALGVHFDTPTWARAGRETKLKENKDGRLIVEIIHDDRDPATSEFANWLVKKNKWVKIFDTKVPQPVEVDVDNYDDIIRHLVTSSNEDLGWVLKHGSNWVTEPLHHIKVYLSGQGMNQKEINKVLSNCISRCWKMVNKPFQSEYPGERQWNKKAVQLTFAPSDDSRNYPSWLKVLNHLGQSLNGALSEHPWAIENHIITGADYLKIWIAAMLQYPTEQLPYLFFYGPQDTGKSIFHEAIDLLLTHGGVVRAEQALESSSGFNAELVHAILCVVEETNLQRDKRAYNRIKDFVTSKKISIHPKGLTPYTIINTTHWCHMANDATACPIFPGDSRITMIYVPQLTNAIPKRELLPRLKKEAPDFLGELLSLDVPLAHERLAVPILETEDKTEVAQSNRSLLEVFLEEKCYHVPGEWIKYRDLYEAFRDWLDPNDAFDWTIIRFGKELPKKKFPKGRNPKDAQFYVGNISFEKKLPKMKQYILRKEMLVQE